MKKLLSLLLATIVLLATQVSTPAYAAYLDSSGHAAVAGHTGGIPHKIDTCKFYSTWQYDLAITGNKLIATGKFNSSVGIPENYNVDFQVVSPVSYSGYDWYSANTAIMGTLTYVRKDRYDGLMEQIPVMRSAACAGADNISLAFDLSGIADGVYQLQEVISNGSKKQGSLSKYIFVVVYNGNASLQIDSDYPAEQELYLYACMSDLWHDSGFYVPRKLIQGKYCLI